MTENLLDVENEILGWHNVHCGSGLNPIRILYPDRNENLKKVLTVISTSKVCCSTIYLIELETKAYPKVRNHGEDPY